MYCYHLVQDVFVEVRHVTLTRNWTIIVIPEVLLQSYWIDRKDTRGKWDREISGEQWTGSWRRKKKKKREREQEREKDESKIWSEDRDGQRRRGECVINHHV